MNDDENAKEAPLKVPEPHQAPATTSSPHRGSLRRPLAIGGGVVLIIVASLAAWHYGGKDIPLINDSFPFVGEESNLTTAAGEGRGPSGAFDTDPTSAPDAPPPPSTPGEATTLLKPYAEFLAQEERTTLIEFQCDETIAVPTGVPDDNAFACLVLLADGTNFVQTVAYASDGSIAYEDQGGSGSDISAPPGYPQGAPYSPQCDPADPRYQPAYC